ncbi:MAG: uracil-DNA glycosylase family protein [Stellaceae bacterium]
MSNILRNHGHDDPANKTNENLWRLLAEAGIRAKHPREVDVDTPVFLTNSVLRLKEGPMNRPVPANCVKACTERHLLPLLSWLKPPVVVGMGSCGWRAVRRAFALVEAPRPISLAAGSHWTAADGTELFAAGHCSPLGLINRPWPQQLLDSRRIGAAVAVV